MKLIAYIPATGLTGIGPRPQRDDTDAIPHHVTVLHCDAMRTRAGTEPDPDVVAWVVRRAVRGCARGDLYLGSLVELGGATEADKAICARVYGLTVHRVRQAILDGLSAFGIECPQTHDQYIPHLTLAYVPEDGTYEATCPTGHFTARTVRYRLDDGPWRTVSIGGADGNPKTALTDGRTTIACRYRSIDFGDALLEEGERHKAGITLPADHQFGRPFVFVSAGAIYYRDVPGEQRGLDITESDLDSVLAIFDSGESTCALDWNHDEDSALGHVAAMWKVTHNGKAALACLPAYDEKGAALVGASSHLWSSPHIEWAGIEEDAAFGAADTGEVFGRMRIAHLAICSDPAQAHRALTAVRLSEGRTLPAPVSGDNDPSTTYAEIEPMDEIQKQIDEMAAAIAAQGEQIAALQAMVEKAMGGEGEMADGEDKDGEDKGEKPEGDEGEMTATEAALKAELAEMRKQLHAQRESARLSDRKARIDALLSSKRLVAGEKAKAEKLFDKAPDLFAEIYEGRPAGSALPTPRGHGQTIEANFSDEANPRHKRALEIQATAKKAGKAVSYVAALTQASAEG